jgi:hypothetical protein
MMLMRRTFIAVPRADSALHVSQAQVCHRPDRRCARHLTLAFGTESITSRIGCANRSPAFSDDRGLKRATTTGLSALGAAKSSSTRGCLQISLQKEEISPPDPQSAPTRPPKSAPAKLRHSPRFGLFHHLAMELLGLREKTDSSTKTSGIPTNARNGERTALLCDEACRRSRWQRDRGRPQGSAGHHHRLGGRGCCSK